MNTPYESSNIHTSSEGTEHGVSQSEKALAQIITSLEQTQSDLGRARRQLDRQTNELDAHVRRTKLLWVVAVLLVISVIGFAWAGYPYISQMPALQSALIGIGDRVQSTEQQFKMGAVADAGFTERLGKFERSLTSGLQDVRNQTRSLTNQMGQRIKAELIQNLHAVETRLTGVESNQREALGHVAQLQSEIGSLRQELNDVRMQSEQQARQQTSQTEQLNQVQQTTTAELSEVRRRVQSNDAAISDVADRIRMQRTEFEIVRNRTEQIAPGIYLTVRQTDVAKQRVDGWLQLASEGRIVWIRGNGAQNPVRFVSKQEQRANEVVFTRIGQDNVSGYLLVPTPESNASLAAR